MLTPVAHDQLRQTAIQVANADPLTFGSVTAAQRITAARLVDAIDAGDDAAIKRLAEVLDGVAFDDSDTGPGAEQATAEANLNR